MYPKVKVREPEDDDEQGYDRLSLQAFESLYLHDSSPGKGLVGRVSEVLGDMVSDSQSVFVINRQIIDATHIANKVVRDVKHSCPRNKTFCYSRSKGKETLSSTYAVSRSLTVDDCC